MSGHELDFSLSWWELVGLFAIGATWLVIAVCTIIGAYQLVAFLLKWVVNFGTKTCDSNTRC